jgi:ankyrin repeat protein
MWADFNVQNNDGSTALMEASRYEHEAVAQLLIDNRTDVKAESKYGSTALIWASRYGHEAVAQLLIDNGADFNV